MDCASELKSVLAADCDTPAVAGVYGKVILLPHDAIDRTVSAQADNVLSNIALKSGRKGAAFDTFDTAVLGAASLVAGTYTNTMQHDLTLRVFVKTEAVKDFVNSFINARVAAIVKNKESGTAGETTYEVYGFDAGMKLTAITSDTSMADGVVYELVLGSDETSKERSLPKSVWAGSLADTETLINSLTAA